MLPPGCRIRCRHDRQSHPARNPLGPFEAGQKLSIGLFLRRPEISEIAVRVNCAYMPLRPPPLSMPGRDAGHSPGIITTTPSRTASFALE
jgi:hypothetical protein